MQPVLIHSRYSVNTVEGSKGGTDEEKEGGREGEKEGGRKGESKGAGEQARDQRLQ